jgi:RNA polymerase sigma-70 factor (ECF subfamily)
VGGGRRRCHRGAARRRRALDDAVGADAVGDFFRTVPAGGFLERIRLVPTRSNGQPAVAAYLRDDAEPVFRAYGVMVFALDGEMVTSITGFADFPTLVPRFGLPENLR